MASPEAVKKWAAKQPNKNAARGDDDAIWKQTMLEAHNAGATLQLKQNTGGVDPGRALHLFRKARWSCSICGSKDDLTLDHVTGHPEATPGELDLRRKEDSNRGIQVLCASCHQVLHDIDHERGGPSRGEE